MPSRALKLVACLAALAGVCAGQPPSNCAIGGLVVNAITGEPVPRAHIVVMGANGQTGTSSDNQGQWHFAGLACGQTQVIATRPGFLQGSLGQPRLGGVFRPVILVTDA